MITDKNTRIAIIGAGSSGLGAAEALLEKRYKNVTIYEKNNRVGGMCCSKSYPAEDPTLPAVIYDLGSVQPVCSQRLFKKVKALNLHPGKKINSCLPTKHRIYSCRDRDYPLDFVKYHFGVPMSQYPSLLMDIFKILPWVFKYKRLKNPGFRQIQNIDVLTQAFAIWIRERNFKILGRALNMICCLTVNGGGWGGVSDIAILYILKILMTDAVTKPHIVRTASYHSITEGYQEVWNRIAKQHDVVLNSQITQISRKEQSTTLYFSDGTQQTFDVIIIACNLLGLNQVLDKTAFEQKIFDQIKNRGTWRFAFKAKNMPHDAAYLILDQAENADWPQTISGFFPEGYLGNDKYLYTTIGGHISPSGVQGLLERSKKLLEDHFGASELEWIDQANWTEYNTHFHSAAIRQGIFDEFESRQGENNTYYVGEILSGQSSGICFDYSYDLVNRFFK